MHWVTWIVNAIKVSLENEVSDVKPKCLEKPVPKSLNWHVSMIKVLRSKQINRNVTSLPWPTLAGILGSGGNPLFLNAYELPKIPKLEIKEET